MAKDAKAVPVTPDKVVTVISRNKFSIELGSGLDSITIPPLGKVQVSNKFLSNITLPAHVAVIE